MASLYEVLIQMRTPDGNRLFKGPADLARQITALPGAASYTSRERSLTTLLGQIFRGERNCPQPLRPLVLEAVRQRLNGLDAAVVEEWVGRTDAAIDALRAERERRTLSVTQARDEATNKTRHIFVISSLFSEVSATPVSIRAIKDTVASLHLRNAEQIPSVRYTICFPSNRDGIDYWRALLRELVYPVPGKEEAHAVPLDPATAADNLAARDGGDYLCVYELPYQYCLSTISLYDPEREDATGFHIFLLETGTAQYVQIPQTDIAGWRRLYYDFLDGKVPSERHRFEAYRQHLLLDLRPGGVG